MRRPLTLLPSLPVVLLLAALCGCGEERAVAPAAEDAVTRGAPDAAPDATTEGELAAVPAAELPDGEVPPPAELPAGREVRVELDGGGYEPAVVAAVAGEPLDLAVQAAITADCPGGLRSDELGLARTPLREGEPTEITVTAPAAGRYAVDCGPGTPDLRVEATAPTEAPIGEPASLTGESAPEDPRSEEPTPTPSR